MASRIKDPSESWPQFLLKAFAVNTAAACLAPLLTWVTNARMTWSEAWLDLQLGFIYAQCIGWMMNFTLPYVSCPLSARPVRIKIPVYFLLITAQAILGTLIAGIIIDHMDLAFHPQFWPFFRANVKLAVFIGTLAGFCLLVFGGMRQRLEAAKLELRTREFERERALKLATEARLSSLESCIHPHFLFNTINSVSSLIHDDPEQAERLLERMAALLRFSLDSQQGGLVTLQQEMKIVGDYLAIEKARFGQRLRYEIDASPTAFGLCVPPLSIQTLVENSVKYAVAYQREGGKIVVRTRERAGVLSISVWDDGPLFTLAALPVGHGLDNLRSRIAVLFDNKASMIVQPSNGGKSIELSLPARTSARKIA